MSARKKKVFSPCMQARIYYVYEKTAAARFRRATPEDQRKAVLFVLHFDICPCLRFPHLGIFPAFGEK